MLLKNKVVVVTGAASPRGIGFATAQRCAEEGARVALLDLNPAAATAAAEAISGSHRGYACDVRDGELCRQVVQQILQDFGQIDVLFWSTTQASASPSVSWTARSRTTTW